MFPRLIAGALFASIGPLVTTTAAAQDEVIVVRANVAQSEIERILNLDNLEVELLAPREVATAMSGIKKGRAPRDFWIAYQAHVKAWQRFASATQAMMISNDTLAAEEAAGGRAEAKLAIKKTFDEVERIARRYGARIPTPRTRSATTY